MAPRRKASSAPARQVATKRPRRNRRRTKSNSSRSLGSYIVKGVNALMCTVPGAKIFKPITDFMFKSFGFTSSSISDVADLSATINIYGMGAAFAVPLSAIIENSPIIPKHHSGEDVQLYTNFSHGQLLNLRVSVRPIGELSHRQGNIALAFIPYTTSESGRFYDANVTIPTLQDVLLVPNAVQGSGTRTLSVNYRARGQQFNCLPHPLTTEIGLVLVAYQDLARVKGSEFAAEDFGAEVIISGAVRLSNPIPHVGYSAVDCKVIDKLATKTIRAGDYDTNGVCEVMEDCVKVTGRFSRVTLSHARSLEGLHPGLRDMPYGSPSSVASMLADATL